MISPLKRVLRIVIEETSSKIVLKKRLSQLQEEVDLNKATLPIKTSNKVILLLSNSNNKTIILLTKTSSNSSSRIKGHPLLPERRIFNNNQRTSLATIHQLSKISKNSNHLKTLTTGDLRIKINRNHHNYKSSSCSSSSRAHPNMEIR